MNYSRTLYFTSMLSSIMERLKRLEGILDLEAFAISLDDALKDSISEIKSRVSSNRLWPVFNSDSDYINRCEMLSCILESFLSGIEKTKAENSKLYGEIKALHKEVLSAGMPKIKAAFLTNEEFAWPSFESVWEAFVADNKCDPSLVYVPFSHVNQDAGIDHIQWYRDMGYPVIPAENYDLSLDSPDIVFYMKPYDCIPEKFYIDAVERNVKRVVYIPYGFEIAGGEQVITYQFRLPLHNKAWKIVGYSQHYKDMAREYGYNDGKNVIALGHPRLDKIEKFLEEKPSVDAEWDEKIGKRKVILWNTHFTIQPNVAWGTYMRWKDTIFDFFSMNNDIVLLWRPHPLFFGAIKEHEHMDELELHKFKDSIKESGNIILDETGDYRSSFYISDALVSDGTSFLLEYLATEKPILYTPKQNGWGLSDESLTKSYYVANSNKDMLDFFEMVKKGEDPRYNERMDTSKRYLMNPDGKIGERIKRYLISEMEKEEIAAADDFIDSIIDQNAYSKRGI